MYSSYCAETDRFCYSLCSFNPFGEVKQVQYANNCSLRGEPAVGIVTEEGVVLATEKKMMMKYAIGSTLKKLQQTGSYMAMTYSGLAPDFRVLSKLFHKMACKYGIIHDNVMPVPSLMMAISSTMQEFTQSSGVRPFGLALLLGGWENEAGILYHLDASGSQQCYKACAIGRYTNDRTSFLEQMYTANMTVEEAISLAIRSIQLYSTKSLLANQIEVGVLDEDGLYRLSKKTVSKYL
ncbi:proteasome subunit alpha type-2-like [Drosophila hydei]|uniref:Proteasome subunit alpha type-2-like n=1 Tax=Drosophila hydei TaxID=7224 RepID=A0A6J1M0L6_DROHY|nr:proteasome subunit alpha type-2-like [Drosophila hydei]